MKKKTLPQLKKALWKLFSEYIRRRDGGRCVTCGLIKRWKDMQAGHFITAATCPPDLYFDERNAHCQCYRCNINLSGNWVVYEQFIIAEYGHEVCDELKRRRHGVVKWTRTDYEEKIREYKEKLKRMPV